jgi:hypothetical protein
MSIYQRDPAAPGANVRRRRVEAPSERLGHAVAFFNASEASRTVAGLSRSLGSPRASVGAAAGSPSEVRITVAWELCWYQWAVDLAEERKAVRALGKGSEVAQLDGPARQWNASVEGGALSIDRSGPVSPDRRRGGWLRPR